MVFSKTKSYGQATVNGWPVDYQIEIPDCVHRLEALEAVIKDIQRTITLLIDSEEKKTTVGAFFFPSENNPLNVIKYTLETEQSLDKDVVYKALGEHFLKLTGCSFNLQYKDKREFDENEPARKEMLEALPSIIKLLKNPTFVETIDKAGYQFDVAAFFKVFALATGWEFTNDIIVSTKPEQDRVSKLETRVKFLEDRLGYK